MRYSFGIVGVKGYVAPRLASGVLLEGEEVLLAVGAGGVASKGAVGGDDAVAGYDDAHRILAVGIAHGANRVGAAHHCGFFGVAHSAAVGYLLQRSPCFSAELGRLGQVEPYGEVA